MEQGESSQIRSGWTMTDFDARIVGWRIYYADGSLVSSKNAEGSNGQREWEATPSKQVQSVKLFYAQMRRPDENYTRIMIGTDYYWREDSPTGPIYGQGNALDPSIPLNPKAGQVKAGGWISDPDFRIVHNKTYADKKWIR